MSIDQFGIWDLKCKIFVSLTIASICAAHALKDDRIIRILNLYFFFGGVGAGGRQTVENSSKYAIRGRNFNISFNTSSLHQSM